MNIEKRFMLDDLIIYIPPHVISYFDMGSTKLLDRKIEVLERLRDGDSLEDIENWEEVFELLPVGEHWD